MINNFFHSHILCGLVWTNVKTLGVTERIDGVVENWNYRCNITGANAHASIHDSPLHVF
jgi:hypothetical protein